MKYKILLASQSPRRRDLLSMLDLPFTVAEPIDVVEEYPATLAAEEVAPYLSRLKAEAYKSKIDEETLVITADTVVIVDDLILGKPHSRDEAVAMLKMLSGRKHQVVTGVTLTTAERMETFSSSTEVSFASIPDEEIEIYVNRFKPYDKAGAYGIQEWIGAVGICGIEGSFYNVMGLPVHRLWTVLKKFMPLSLSEEREDKKC